MEEISKAAVDPASISLPGWPLQFAVGLKSGTAGLHPLIGAGAGDFYVAVVREVRRELGRLQGNRQRVIETAFERMRYEGLISDEELQRITRIAHLALAVERGDEQPEAGRRQARAIYQDMLVDKGATPVALAIASMATMSPDDAIADGLPNDGVIFSQKTDEALILGGGALGALAGARLGAEIGFTGGFVGGLIGAVVGGVVGAVVASCAD